MCATVCSLVLGTANPRLCTPLSLLFLSPRPSPHPSWFLVNPLQFQHEQQLPELESRLRAIESGACALRGWGRRCWGQRDWGMRGRPPLGLLRHTGFASLAPSVASEISSCRVPTAWLPPVPLQSRLPLVRPPTQRRRNTIRHAVGYWGGRRLVGQGCFGKAPYYYTLFSWPPQRLDVARPAAAGEGGAGGDGGGGARGGAAAAALPALFAAGAHRASGRRQARSALCSSISGHSAFARTWLVRERIPLPYPPSPFRLRTRAAPAGERQWGYGVVVSAFRKQQQERQGIPATAAAAYVIDTLLCVAGSSNGGRREQGAPEPAALQAANAEMQAGGDGAGTGVGPLHHAWEARVPRPGRARRGAPATVRPARAPADPAVQPHVPQVVPVPLPLVTDISTLRVSIPADLRQPESCKAGARLAPACRSMACARFTAADRPTVAGSMRAGSCCPLSHAAPSVPTPAHAPSCPAPRLLPMPARSAAHAAGAVQEVSRGAAAAAGPRR